MGVTNQAHKAIEQHWKNILDNVEKKCRTYCSNLCLEAVKQRQQMPGSHNFTGNLLNSIVVCLYRDNKPVAAYYAAQYAAEAIQVKMRMRKSRRYFFNPDYEGEKSAYLPTIQTNGGWGVDDARKFFQEYRPGSGNVFDIVVVYPVEYATWIEYKRGTTGIVNTRQYAETIGVSFLKAA